MLCARGNVLALALLVSVLLAITALERSVVNAPELFGQGNAYGLRVSSVKVELVSAWGLWLSLEQRRGDVAQCLLVPLSSELSDAQIVYCEKWYRGSKFAGFIYFRGHERAYCGASSAGMIPDKCLKIGAVSHG